MIDQSTSKFTRDIIRAASKRDPVDVANELQVLADMFGERADRLLEEGIDWLDLAVQNKDDK